MKRKYVKPIVEGVFQVTSIPMCYSDIYGANSVTFGYGGVDTNGSLDPSAKKRGCTFDEDDWFIPELDDF